MQPIGYTSLIIGADARWHSGESSISFSFMSEAPDYYRRTDTDGDGEDDRLHITGSDKLGIDDSVEMTADERALSLLAIEAWNEVANVNLVEAADGTVGDITFGSAAFPGDFGTFGFITKFPDIDDVDTPNKRGDLWINSNNPDQDVSVFGHTSWNTYLHELGHSLGLSHPAEDPNNFDNSPDNSNKYSVMSYVEHPNQEDYGLSSQGWPLTPMLYDIAAIQDLYGANTETRNTDTVYFGDGFGDEDAAYQYGEDNMKVSGRDVILTIWDGGGHDLIDASDVSSGVKINLAPGKFSTIGDVANNVAIAYAVEEAGEIVNLIEDAWGTIQQDILNGNSGRNNLWGNDQDDLLKGRAGKDFLEGGTGKDDLRGGKGADTLEGGKGNDTLTGNKGADVFVFDHIAKQGFDTITDFEDGKDLIEIEGGSFAALVISQTSGGDARIDLENGGVIVLADIDQSQISADDFLFA